MESLRFDHHMSLSFVSLQQIMAFMLLGAGMVTLSLRQITRRRGLAVAGLIVLAVSLGVCIALEFAIDRTTVSRYWIYAVYVIALAAPVWLGIRLRKEDE